MSTLAMALAAVMVAGSSPEKVSGEVEQRLDLRGSWEGTVQDKDGTLSVTIEQERLRVVEGESHFSVRWKCTDEARGKCRVESMLRLVYPGIYKLEGDRVILCVRVDGKQPASFRSSESQWLLTLRPVRPGK